MVNAVDPFPSASPFRIATNRVLQFAGRISDLAMWGRALGASEVAAVRTSGVRSLPADPALRVAIRGGEGSGTIAADSSGNGNRANFVGSASWSTSCPTRR